LTDEIAEWWAGILGELNAEEEEICDNKLIGG
jgi:hypothetical protein